MGLLSSAKNKVNQAKKSLGKVKSRLSRVTKGEQELQDELNYYQDLEGQVEQEIQAGQTQQADQEARKIEDKEMNVVQELRSLDEEVLEILGEDLRDAEMIAQGMKDRERFEKNTSNKIRQISEEHRDFDERLKQSSQNLERYLNESKQDSNRMTRSEAGREAQTDEGKNWQQLAQEAQHIRDSIEMVVNNESNMLEFLDAEEKTIEEFENEWRQSLQALKRLKGEIKTFYGEEEEMKKIAQKLEDSELMQEVASGEEEAEKIKNSLTNLDDKIQQIEQILEKLESEDKTILDHQTNVRNAAENIKSMASQAQSQVEGVEEMVLTGDNYEHLNFTSPDKWKQEIEVMRQSISATEQLVQKFEEIEETEIKIEEKEEQVLEQERQQGATALGDD